MKVAILAALVCVAWAGPTHPILKAEHHECRCETHIMRDGARSERGYLPVVIDRFWERNNKCDDSTIDECKEVCLKEVKQLTHSYDLLKPLSDGSHLGLILGDVICTRVLLQEIHNKQLTLVAHVDCQVDQDPNSEEPIYLNTAVPTGLHSRYQFSCVGSIIPHFEIGDLVEPTTASPNATNV